jgi:hypothetical protein
MLLQIGAHPLGRPPVSLRVRAIVSPRFNVAFESGVPLIAALVLGDLHSALLVASLVTGTYALGIVSLRGRRKSQRSERDYGNCGPLQFGELSITRTGANGLTEDASEATLIRRTISDKPLVGGRP